MAKNYVVGGVIGAGVGGLVGYGIAQIRPIPDTFNLDVLPELREKWGKRSDLQAAFPVPESLKPPKWPDGRFNLLVWALTWGWGEGAFTWIPYVAPDYKRAEFAWRLLAEYDKCYYSVHPQ